MPINIKITSNGINTRNLQDVLPDLNEVKFCENILRFITEKKTFNEKYSSYGYKHLLEKNYTNGYISNGAFIQAAQNLGFSIKPQGLNAYFKFSKKDLEAALFTYLSSTKKIKTNRPNIS